MKTKGRLLHVLFSDPCFYPPILRGTRLQCRAGWKVGVLGAEVGSAPQSPPPDWLGDRITLVRSTHLPTTVRYVVFLLKLLIHMVRARPQWIYLSSPLSTPAGVVAVLWPGIKVVYHEHDAPVSENRNLRGMIMAGCRRFVAGRVEACVVPSRGRLAFLPSARRQMQLRVVVNNVPLCSETRSREKLDESELRILFLGSMVPERLPLAVVEALGEIPEARLLLVGYETARHPEYAMTVIAKARELGVEDRVVMEGFVPSFQELPDIIRRCDLGLSLLPVRADDPNQRTMVGASNKVFQFLACQVPVLVPDERGWREAYVDAGVARSCVPFRADSVATAFQWFVEHPEKAWRMGLRGQRLVLKRWNYETEFEPVLRMLDESTGAIGGGADQVSLEDCAEETIR